MKKHPLKNQVVSAVGISVLTFFAPLNSELLAHREPEPPVVQIALLLDTSNSMDGLINQAKTQLWKVVNEFGSTPEGRKTAPVVQVALYEYGNDSLSKRGHWIRCILPMSRDLDRVSEELFSLTTNGGSEFCGAVLRRAVQEIAWSRQPRTATRPSLSPETNHFTQGPIHYRSVCEAAVEAGIVINTIHCGKKEAGIEGRWRHGAKAGGGEFMTIDQNSAVMHIHAPQDRRIAELNEKLNDTYLAYGGKGRAEAEGESDCAGRQCLESRITRCADDL